MHNDVHDAALRAAAKVAFSVVFLGGCGGAATLDGDPSESPGEEPTTAEADLSAKGKKKPKVVVPASTSCHGNDASAPAPSCESVVNAAFPTEGQYPGTKKSVSTQVQTCCVELLSGDVTLSAHRWDCCANLPPNPEPNVVMACTPWGPPVPPAMKRRATAARLDEVA